MLNFYFWPLRLRRPFLASNVFGCLLERGQRKGISPVIILVELFVLLLLLSSFLLLRLSTTSFLIISSLILAALYGRRPSLWVSGCDCLVYEPPLCHFLTLCANVLWAVPLRQDQMLCSAPCPVSDLTSWLAVCCCRPRRRKRSRNWCLLGFYFPTECWIQCGESSSDIYGPRVQ